MFRPGDHEMAVQVTADLMFLGHTCRVANVSDLVPRRAQSPVSEALEDTRVVLINGARQAGKSTLTRLRANSRPGTVVRLLDGAATLRAAQDDPAGFVEHHGLMV